MNNPFKIFVLVFAFLGFVGLSACGSDSEPTASSASPADSIADEGGDDEKDKDDDHKDDDHKDDDHDKDEDHDDEMHDEDKDDDEGHDHDDDKKSGLGAHEHGAAELTVAWAEGDMVIDLISPTHNIFGFENEATTEEEKAVAKDRTNALTTPGILAINAEAGCELIEEVSTELEYEGSHAEITASWEYSCENQDAINELETAELFKEFPNLEDLDVQWTSDAGQSSAELTPDSTTLALS